MLKLIDSHCHAQFPQYDGDRDEVIMRSLDAGIGMINIGTDLHTSKQAIALAEQYDGVWTSVGLHPNDAPQEIFDESVFLELAKHPRVVAIGETGLDFYRTKGDVEHKRQRENFEAHITLSNKVKKPLSLHIRDAYQEAADVLKNNMPQYGAVVHCFTGTYEEAKLFLDMGFYISITGIVTFSKALQEVVLKLPIEKILVETDAPFLSPAPHRGKRNEPAFVEFVAQKVAEIKDLPLNEVCEIMFKNTKHLFTLDEKV